MINAGSLLFAGGIRVVFKPLRAPVRPRIVSPETGDDFHGKLPGVPSLCRVILDAMADSPRPLDIRCSLAHAVNRTLSADESSLAGQYCLAFLMGNAEWAETVFKTLRQYEIPLPTLRLMAFRPVRLVLAARRIISLLHSTVRHRFPASQLPEDLVQELGRIAANDPVTSRELLRLLKGSRAKYHPMVASAAHAARLDWQPRGHKMLMGGYFDEADWRGVDLSKANSQERRSIGQI
jgi:hypothetical protein